MTKSQTKKIRVKDQESASALFLHIVATVSWEREIPAMKLWEGMEGRISARAFNRAIQELALAKLISKSPGDPETAYVPGVGCYPWIPLNESHTLRWIGDRSEIEWRDDVQEETPDRWIYQIHAYRNGECINSFCLICPEYSIADQEVK